MDGYTVEEAATVLGVPRERVWELLARGILGGSTDLGGAMRVRLKVEPAEQPMAQPSPSAPPPSAPSPTTELTPFRELLTEFRSLTERYGQALLALGEARGETASLRARVDALEARADLRLSSSAPPISSSWNAVPWRGGDERPAAGGGPRATAPDGRAGPSAEAAERADTDAADAATPGSRRRGRGGRRATQEFAEALARADDPSVPELPGAQEAAAALAALRAEQGAAVEGPEPPSASTAEPPTTTPTDAPPVLDAAADTELRALAFDAVPDDAPLDEPPRAVADGAVDVAAGWDRARYSSEIVDPGWMAADEPETPRGGAQRTPADAMAAGALAQEAPDRVAEGPSTEAADPGEADLRGGPPVVSTDAQGPAPTTAPEAGESASALAEGLAALDALASPPRGEPEPEPEAERDPEPEPEPEREPERGPEALPPAAGADSGAPQVAKTRDAVPDSEPVAAPAPAPPVADVAPRPVDPGAPVESAVARARDAERSAFFVTPPSPTRPPPGPPASRPPPGPAASRPLPSRGPAARAYRRLRRIFPA